MLPSQNEQHDADEHADHRDSGQEEFRAEQSGDQHEHAPGHKDEPDAAAAYGKQLQTLTPLPGEICRERHDQEAVRVVLIHRPVVNQLQDDVPVQKYKSAGEQCRRRYQLCAG